MLLMMLLTLVFVDATVIRRWGCSRTETPFIFVHIGKCGGGSVRYSLGLSAYAQNKRIPGFSLDTGTEVVNVKLRNECKAYFQTDGTNHSFPCHASTPAGAANGCPQPVSKHCTCDAHSDICPRIHVGHSRVGAEFHWLSDKYLSKWWRRQDKRPKALFQRVWNPTSHGQYVAEYHTHGRPQHALADAHALKAFNATDADVVDWSPLYASMPVLRATLVREPFSFLLSKFYWHAVDARCSDLDTATDPSFTFAPHVAAGWATRFAMTFITYLCGDDCQTLLERELLRGVLPGSPAWEKMVLKMEIQATGNLRRSFALVGLLNESSTFLDMIEARVQYINLTKRGLNLHKSGRHKRIICVAKYDEPAFREKLMARSVAVAVLVRLFHVAVEVNRFQLEELKSCSATFKALTNG